MKIAVFDTYVVRPDGRRMHFDILVSDEAKDMDKVLSYGRRYLEAKGVSVESFTSRECRFCHTEMASAPVENEIKRSGFAILELENCE
ncbi:DUF2024 family protein [Alcaligenes aquatilis]|jgi:hypothetical protein|uniref:DUF2024 family protein n=2 Tax=Alcaligenes TaxID=507 RepID=A0A3G2HVK0_9BURK|nr:MULTISPECIES: DUF2024 family protein [Alcaligenes]ASR89867.1 hypothetical protein AFA_10630 [Alcaligenes faecalis]AWG34675.1 hypothetical protein CA948_05845 [Alcaligenes aquatilis]AYN21084.1 DUF2024 family protein [Alcaligenes aquatilis]MCC9162412.1 DUF2024 family protein [Alcaligenes sp. MMA]MCH4224444.1 DUF2024 family protein [Alcaligenes faecalis]